MFYRKYPKFVSVASKRYQHYNQTVEKISQLENEGQIYVIRPHQALQIGRLYYSKNKN